MRFKHAVAAKYFILSGFEDLSNRTRKWVVDFLNGQNRDYDGRWKTPPIEAIEDLETFRLESRHHQASSWS